jgi:hypothetical protein
MCDFQKTTCSSRAAQFLIVKVHVLHLGVITKIRACTTPGVTKVLQITVRLGKTRCSPYKFKIAGLVKKWTIWGTFGRKFTLSLLVYGHLSAAGVQIRPL